MIFNFSIHAQDSLNIAGSAGFYAQAFGPEVLGIHVNINAGGKASINFGIGGNLDYHLGLNYYFGNRHFSKSTIYAGLQVASIREFLFFGSDGHERQIGLYIPIGYEYVAKKGFSLQIDVGPNFVGENWEQSNTQIIQGSFKIGYVIKSKS